MVTCGKCKIALWDPQFYYRFDRDNSTSANYNKKTLIKCPNCNRITYLLDINKSNVQLKKENRFIKNQKEAKQILSDQLK